MACLALFGKDEHDYSCVHGMKIEEYLAINKRVVRVQTLVVVMMMKVKRTLDLMDVDGLVMDEGALKMSL